MAKAILRIAKLKTGGNIGGLNQHCTRTMEVPNADPELRHYNKQLVGTPDMVKDVNDRIAKAGCNVRKNAVLAIEHLMTASPEAFGYKKVVGQDGKPVLQGDVKAWNEFETCSMKWLTDQYGAANVVNVHVHKDEETPHIHAVVVPIKDGKLNARHFINGREKLSEMQDTFSESVKHIGIERGIKGSRAKHVDIKTFYSQLEEGKKYGEGISEKIQKVAESAPKIAISTPPALTGREDWRQKQELTVNKQVKEYVSKVQEETNKLSDHLSTIHTLTNDREYLKKRTHKAEQENKKLKEELKASVKEKECLIKFASKLEVNGKPFMEAFKEHNKEQEKQQQKNSIKMRW
jgi:hypothetical protein